MRKKLKKELKKEKMYLRRGFKIKKINIDETLSRLYSTKSKFIKKVDCLILCARKDLNPQPSDPKSDALSS